MSKKTQNEIPADMWLHVATDALARYAAGGGELRVTAVGADKLGDAELVIILPATLEDGRLSPAFVALFAAPPSPTEAAP